MAFAAVIFDAYGTLLDVHSAMARHAERVGPAWQAISADWRQKQLEYTWIRSLAGPTHHRDFSELTDAALAFVAARHGIADSVLLADLRRAYRALSAYPEAPALLAFLGEAGISRAILSNGSPDMLHEGIQAAGLADLLDSVLSVESAGIFKPHPSVYALAAQRFGIDPAQMLFVSSNAWDAFGALSNGFQVAWINRSAQPDEYGLRGAVTELPNLAGVEALLA